MEASELEHVETLRLASLIPRGVAHVQLLDLLENF
jgi:hypothetical protein